MILSSRSYRAESDYWRIRSFLQDVLLANHLHLFSWCVQRLDYWRWHGIDNNQCCEPLNEVVFLWETPSGEISAVLHPEERGDCFMQVHPAFKSPSLELEIISVAEDHLSVTRNGRQQLQLWADSQDRLRQELLSARGYTMEAYVESQWHRNLTEPIPPVPVAEGYTVRPLGSSQELPARAWASWRGFHPGEPDDGYSGPGWYHNIQRCPLYRRDLDMVASIGETIASFATFWFDDVTRTVLIEPVATVPEHQCKGLSPAVTSEGLRRAQRLGALRAFVGGYGPGPDALYASVLSPLCDRSISWLKQW